MTKILILVSLVLLTGCVDCNYDLEYERVKSFSVHELKDIYDFLANESSNLEREYSSFRITSELSIPHLNPVVGRLTKEGAHLVIGGCLDDKSYLHVTGLNYEVNKNVQPLITLDRGEGANYEILELWRGE